MFINRSSRGHTVLIPVLLLLAASFIVLACGGGGGSATPPGNGNTAALTSITVTPANPSIVNGTMQQFAATGNYSDNSTTTITTQVTWQSSSTAVATISGAGMATAVGIGSTQISATLGAVSGNTTLTVTSSGGGTPAISGFNFNLSTGDYWEYGWKESESIFSISGTTNKVSTSYFRVTLGAPVSIQGKDAYPIQFSGTGQYVGNRWTHLALANNILYASADGATLKQVFNAQTGLSPGNGFFRNLGSSLYEALASSISNTFMTDSSVYALTKSTSSSQCQYYPDVGSICGDTGSTSYVKEYYKENIGPVGYYNQSAFTSGSGADYINVTTIEHIGLVRSSLRGDIVGYKLEHEPNNTIQEATAVTLPVKYRGDAQGDSSTNAVRITLVAPSPVETAEVEPNDSKYTAQAITLPALVTGDTSTGDQGTSTSIAYSFPDDVNAYIEDWYSFALTSGGKLLSFSLDFSGQSPVDLDLYLLKEGQLFPVQSSIAYNIQSGTYTESILWTCQTGTYYVAVDAYETRGQRANYRLDIHFSAIGSSNVPVYDWYRVTLATAQSITASATNGWTIVLTDGVSTTAIANGIPASSDGAASFTSPVLSPGAYYLGMGYTSSVKGQYVLDITAQ